MADTSIARRGRAFERSGFAAGLDGARAVLGARAGLWLVVAGIFASGVLGVSDHQVTSAVLVAAASISALLWLLQRRVRAVSYFAATLDVAVGLGCVAIDQTLWTPALIVAAAGLCEAAVLFGRRGLVRLGVVALGGFTALGIQADGWRSALPGLVGLGLVAGLAVPLLYRVVQRNRHERFRLDQLLDGVEAVVWELDRSTRRFTYVSGFAHQFGIDARRWIDDPEAWLAVVHPDDRHLVGVSSLLDYAEHGQPIEIRAGGGPEYAKVFRINSSVVALGHPSERRIRGVVMDISDLRKHERQIRHQARHDALTGLANRAAVVSQLEQELAEREPRVALLLLDLDRFKEVNDALGHHRGDTLLREVAVRLTASIPPGAFVGRLGGDEFAVVVPLVGRPDTFAAEVADRVVAALVVPVISEGLTMQIGVSIGIAVAPFHGTTQDQLFRRADMTMYVAKRGGGGWALWQPEFEAETARSFHLATALRQAIEDGAIGVEFQPRVSMRTNRVLGFEALGRWHDPRLGSVPPTEFVAAAQVAGVGLRLVTSIVRSAVGNFAELRLVDPALLLAVNVTTTDLVMQGFEEMLVATLDAFHHPYESLILELSEGEAIQNAKLLAQVLGRLSERGIRLSIDDFGQGYSSMDRLRSLPLNEIKIDHAFVSRMRQDPTDRAIVASIIQLGHSLALDVVAEGVEEPAIRADLAELGCDAYQGTLFRSAMPLAEARSLVRWQQPDPRVRPLEGPSSNLSGLAAPHA